MKLYSAIFALFLLLPSGTGNLPNVNSAPWDEILHQYVTQQHLVDYAKLKQQDWKKLREFVSGLGQQGSQPLSPTATKNFPNLKLPG